MGNKGELPLPEGQEIADMFEQYLNNPEVEETLDQTKDAPIIIVGAIGVILNDGKRRVAQIVTLTGGVVNPGRKFGFPPKESRDAAAKEFGRSVRKGLTKSFDAFDKGKGIKEGSGTMVTGSASSDGKIHNRKEVKV